MQYLDFDVEIGQGQGREYPMTVRSPAGEAHATLHFPFDELALESRLKDLRIALLRSSGQHRRVHSPEELAVQDFGQRLFEALFTGEVRSRYVVTRQDAGQRRQGVRLRLRILAPELAALPWELLYDAQQDEYLSLSRLTPLVRYLDLPQPLQPLQVELPLRILGMIASPNDQAPLDIAREQGRMQAALQDLEQRGLVKLTWVSGQTWRDLQRALQGGPWHVFHFIGHGGYHPTLEEGMVAFANEQGQTHLLRATELGRLLANHPSLRLAVLNACEGAKGGERDLFSSTAATLARKGIPAVLAMQYEITDRAAIECTRAFYEAIAGGLSVDEALAEARLAISLGVANTLEWGIPVLYLRAADSRLFLPPSQTTTRPGSSGVMPAPPPGGSGVSGGSSLAKAAGTGLGDSSSSKPLPVLSPPARVSVPPDFGGASGHQAGQRLSEVSLPPKAAPVGTAGGTQILKIPETAVVAEKLATKDREHLTADVALASGALPREKGRRRREGGFRRWAVVIVACLLALALIGGGTIYSLLRLLPTATVTIMPQSSDVKKTSNLTAVTDTPDPSKMQVGARIITLNTQTYTVSEPATGLRNVPATQATGTLVFTRYASPPGVLQYAAGTTFTGTSGVTVAIDAAITVAAGSSGSVTAHAVTAGTEGNIPALDITHYFAKPGCGSICYIYGSVQNPAAFTGGTNSTSTAIVQQSDIDAGANTLIQAHQPDPQQTIQTGMPPGEQLIGTQQCSPKVSANHRAGDVALQVTVRVTFTCTGEAYDHDDALALAAQLLKDQAASNPGADYGLVGQIKTTLVSATLADQGEVQLVVDAEGIWAYQFHAGKQQALANLIAGKSKQEAQKLLATQTGVAQVEYTTRGR